jgi:hypothetical protein
MIKDRELYRRLISKCYMEDGSDCLIWGGAKSDGYGRTAPIEGETGAHRVMWILCNGPIAEGMQLDHLCRRRDCVRPAHLEVVTKAENMRRGAANGQALYNWKCQDPTHTRVERKGGIRCRECYREQQRLRMKKWRAKNPEAYAATQAAYRERKRESGP